jgi:hypothetical protein
VAMPEAMTQAGYLLCARANATGHGEIGSRGRRTTNLILVISTPVNFGCRGWRANRLVQQSDGGFDIAHRDTGHRDSDSVPADDEIGSTSPVAS